MAHQHHDPRTRPVPDEVRERARALMRERGPRGAAAALGISRSALLAVCGGADVLPGTLALLREAMNGRTYAGGLGGFGGGFRGGPVA